MKDKSIDCALFTMLVCFLTLIGACLVENAFFAEHKQSAICEIKDCTVDKTPNSFNLVLHHYDKVVSEGILLESSDLCNKHGVDCYFYKDLSDLNLSPGKKSPHGGLFGGIILGSMFGMFLSFMFMLCNVHF